MSNDFTGPTDNLIDVAVPDNEPDKEVRAPRARMTGSERRHQLIDIARSLFAERGYEGTSIEEIALRANVSKPVVYEHSAAKKGCTRWSSTGRCRRCWTASRRR